MHTCLFSSENFKYYLEKLVDNKKKYIDVNTLRLFKLNGEIQDDEINEMDNDILNLIDEYSND